jgi:hypothetical protein
MDSLPCIFNRFLYSHNENQQEAEISAYTSAETELNCLFILVPSRTLSADITTQRRMVGWLENDEFKIIGQEAVVTKPERVPGSFEGWTE